MTRAERQLLAAQRRAQVVEMHTSRKMTFEAIGKQLGVTAQRAHQIWRATLLAMPAVNLMEHRTEAVNFCDQMVQELLLLARRPDTAPRTTAELHRQVLGWEERRAKLLGLDQPVRREITVLTEDAVDAALRKVTDEHAALVAQAKADGVDIDAWLTEH